MQSCGVGIVHICCILLELSVREKKNKIEIFMFDFFKCGENKWNSGSIFYIRIVKDFHL